MNVQAMREVIPPTDEVRALLRATVYDRRFLLELLRLAERRDATAAAQLKEIQQ
jgi:hypothetical protein